MYERKQNLTKVEYRHQNFKKNMKGTTTNNSGPRPNKHVDFVQQANSRFPRQTFGGFSQISHSLCSYSPTFQQIKRAEKNPNYHYLA